MIRLNCGCGADLLENYVNIDRHSREEIEKRYGWKLPKNIDIQNLDIFNLPYGDGTVDEVLCLGFLEHLSFEEEGRFLKEVKRVLKKDGIFHFTVPDFDNLCRQWLEAKDDFKEFYQLRTDEHWFGQGNRNLKNKWGYLTAFIYGNQNGEGQFHRNAYTIKKILKIMKILGFSCTVSTFYFKNTEALMLECKAYKK
ncbi:MAG: class I SAM-dependent methyltransferase [Nanoarchaeota archaeon]